MANCIIDSECESAFLNANFEHSKSKYHSIISLTQYRPRYYKHDSSPKLFVLSTYWPLPAAEFCWPGVEYDLPI
jgi:hypothetical protein